MSSSSRQDLGNVQALLELVDAQHQVIERLQRALQEHEQVEADRHMLKRMLAHELRTPLAAVIGALHTLSIPELPADKADEMRERALRQAQQLNELIDDILDLADPHDARVDRTPQEWVAVEELVGDVELAITPWLPPGRLIMTGVAGLAIRTLPSRVRQILVNLLVNAAKYGPSDAPVHLSVTRLSDAVLFEVIDEGPGIAPEKVEVLFQPFERGAAHAGVEGVGLGLYLTRNLVWSLGGTIELLPRAEGGTLARVRLPQKRLEDADTPVIDGGRHLRVVPTAE